MPAFPTIPTAPMTLEFGAYRPDLYKFGDHRHTGTDYGVPVGSPVYACMDGVVETATVSSTGYGRHVIIRHSADGACSIYGHLSSMSVAVGNTVTSGQQIGKSGGDPNDRINGDGNSTGAHLHWEIRTKENKPVDPYEYCMGYIPIPPDTATVIATVGLNVRSEPNDKATVLYTLKEAQVVRIESQVGDWTELHALRPEYCFSKYLIVTVAKPCTEHELTQDEKVQIMWEDYCKRSKQ